MEAEDFFSLLAGDLRKEGLTREQAESALLYHTGSENDKRVVKAAIEKAYGSWIPSGMIATTDSHYDYNAPGSYTARLTKRLIDDEEECDEEVTEEEVVKEAELHNKLVESVVETATLLEARGYSEETDTLDEFLFNLAKNKRY